MDTVTVEALKDSKGRLIPTVIARLISDKEEQDAAVKARTDEDDVLVYLHTKGKHDSSVAEVAEQLGWFFESGEDGWQADEAGVYGALEKLKKFKLVEIDRMGWILSPKDQKKPRTYWKERPILSHRTAVPTKIGFE